MAPKYPEVTVPDTGDELATLAAAAGALYAAGHAAEVAAFVDEATAAGDTGQMLAVTAEWVTVIPPPREAAG